MTIDAGFREARDLLVGGDRRGSDFSRAYAELVDRWLAELLGDERDVALVALGSYGRRELAPGSDIDVLLVHRRRADVRDVAERLWYPMWDAGVKVGHAVRTLREAITLAARDVEVATSMLDARTVAGDPALGVELSEATTAQWRKQSDRWRGPLLASVQQRHARAGEVAFLLEPDLKSGRGGLRDIHTLRWVEVAEAVTFDRDAIDASHEALLAVRIDLHRVTDKAHDVLWLQDQDAVARAQGDRDADVLMARVASAARTIAWASDEVWDELGAGLGRRRRRHVSRDRRLAPDVDLREGVAELAEAAQPLGDPALVLRVAVAAAESGVRIGRSTLERLAIQPAPMPSPWPAAARNELVALLATGGAAIPVLEALDQKGLLAWLIPEWEAVRSRPQRNAYHRYTVDRHLCEAAVEAAARTHRVSRPDLLLLATWLHDIGKGFTRPHGDALDHTAVGVDLIATIATRMGFPPDDVVRLQGLVRHHLLLADTATRRDLEDPATIEAVAVAVDDQETLALLHALTEADSIATGPAAWSTWKAGLIDELVARTRKYLRGDSPIGPSPAIGDSAAALIERARESDRVIVDVVDGDVTVVAHDRPGLFSRIAGTLTLHQLDVLTARAWSTDDGFAVDMFQVEPQFGQPDWDVVREDLERAIGGGLALDARLTERARAYSSARSQSAVPPRRTVSIDNDASASSSVIEVRAPDRPGVLFRVTRALAELNLDIRHAKVATLGHEVVDSFYVVDAEGGKIVDPDQTAEIERAVLVELDRV